MTDAGLGIVLSSRPGSLLRGLDVLSADADPWLITEWAVPAGRRISVSGDGEERRAAALTLIAAWCSLRTVDLMHMRLDLEHIEFVPQTRRLAVVGVHEIVRRRRMKASRREKKSWETLVSTVRALAIEGEEWGDRLERWGPWASPDEMALALDCQRRPLQDDARGWLPPGVTQLASAVSAQKVGLGPSALTMLRRGLGRADDVLASVQRRWVASPPLGRLRSPRVRATLIGLGFGGMLAGAVVLNWR